MSREDDAWRVARIRRQMVVELKARAKGEDETTFLYSLAEVVLLFARIDELIGAGEIVVSELARHGWGDMHYSMDSPQERSVVDAVAAWRAVAPEVKS